MHMTSVVGYKKQPLYHQLKRRSSSHAGKTPSRINPTSDKGQGLIKCSSANIPIERNMDRGGGDHYTEEIIHDKDYMSAAVKLLNRY